MTRGSLTIDRPEAAPAAPASGLPGLGVPVPVVMGSALPTPASAAPSVESLATAGAPPAVAGVPPAVAGVPSAVLSAVPSKRDRFAAAVSAVIAQHKAVAAAQARLAGLIEEARIAGTALHSTDSFTGGPQWSSDMVVERQIITELAVALHQSENDTRRLIHTSEGLAGPFTATRTALATGAISYRHAEKIIQHSNTLPAASLEAYEHELLPQARKVTVQRLDHLARAAIEHSQPRTAVQRHLDAANRRRLDLDPAADGMAYLTHYLPAVEAVAIYNRATDLARSAKNTGDPRTLTHLRTDTLTDLLLNGETHILGITPGIRARIHVTVPALTLLNHPTPSTSTPGTPTPRPTATTGTVTPTPGTPTHAPGTPSSTSHPRISSSTSHPRISSSSSNSSNCSSSSRDNRQSGTRTGASHTDHPGGTSNSTGIGGTTSDSSTTSSRDETSDTDTGTASGSDTYLGDPAGGHGWANLEGYGPIDRLTALHLTRNAPTFTRVLTDPTTGCALTYGRQKYRPPADLDELIRLTHTECTFPTSCTSSATADLDHTIAWDDGGTTALHNLSPLCTTHHKVKHHTEWRIEQSPTGTITWTSPAGFEYAVQPTPIAPPRVHFDDGATTPPPF